MSASTEFANRRQELWVSMAENSVLIVAGAKLSYRNRDVEYPFRQNSDFYYLTGFEEPNALLVLLPHEQGHEFVMFNQVRDPDMEVWNGPRAGQDGAIKEYGANSAYPIDELDEKMLELIADYERIYYSFSDKSNLSENILSWCKKISSNPRYDSSMHEFIDIDPILHEQRIFKSDAEIAQMRAAANITVGAHKRAMQKAQPGQFEYELEAEIIHEFVQQGCRQQAYGAIVGGGANSCILHYVNNNDPLRDGDLVLIDAGAEYNNYASDVTRTFPVNGKFSEQQKSIYNIVLDAQLAVIDSIKPGLQWNILQQTALRIITEGLVKLKILSGDVEKLITEKKHMQFYMHGIGHWLGLDVHDVGNYKIDNNWRNIEPNMTFTVEPGIYIAADDSVDQQWWNIGVRIEDDVLVTKNGCEVLTADLPKTVTDIEQLMAAR